MTNLHARSAGAGFGSFSSVAMDNEMLVVKQKVAQAPATDKLVLAEGPAKVAGVKVGH